MDKKIAPTRSAINQFACNFTSLSVLTLIYFDVVLLLVLIVAGVLA